MSIPYEKAVAEDLNLGHGTTSVTNPAGGSLTGSKIGAHTFFGESYLNAADFSGGDIGEKVNTAIAALTNNTGTIDGRSFRGSQPLTTMIADGGKTVAILLGDVRLSSSLATAFTLSGNGSSLIGIGASTTDTTHGTVITHTGTGACIQLGSTSDGTECPNLAGFRIVGSSAGSHGIKAYSRLGVFEQLIISGYTGASAKGIELITSDASPSFVSYGNTFRNLDVRTCTTLVKLTSATVAGGANANSFIGGRYLGPFTTGFLLDNAVYTNFLNVDLEGSSTANSISLDIQGTSQLTTWVGGLIEGNSGTNSIGIKTAANTLSTKVINASVTGNTTDYSDGSTAQYTNLWPGGVSDPFTFEQIVQLDGLSASTKEPTIKFNYAGDNIGQLRLSAGGVFVLDAASGGTGPFILQLEKLLLKRTAAAPTVRFLYVAENDAELAYEGSRNFKFRATSGLGAGPFNLIPDASGATLGNSSSQWRVYNQVIATASLPAASSAMDGVVIIEDAGAGNRNLIIYGGGERFRIDGGAAV